MKAHDFATYLADQGVGTLGTDIFASHQPDIASCVTVIDTGGLEPDRYLPHANVTFQVIVRDVDYATAVTKAETIVSTLNDNNNVTVGSDHHYFIFLMTEPTSIGRDEKGREEISINFVTRHRR